MIEEDQEGLDLQLSLEAGLRRASDVEETIEEIQGVLTDLDETVKRVTGLVVSVSLESPRRTTFGQYMSVLEFFKSPASHVDPEDREIGELEVLAKITPTLSHADTRKICSMTMSEAGYPITVDSGTHLDGCHDATALRRSLAQVLGRATTGRKLRALIQRHQDRQAQQKLGSPVRGELGETGNPDDPDDQQK